MKKSLSILAIVVFLFSCGSKENKTVEEIVAENNLEEIRAKRAEIVDQQTLFAEQLEFIDTKIAELDSNKKIPLVTSFVVAEAIFNHYVELQGNVSTKNLLVIYPEFAGILTNVYVKEGDKVTKGQTLAKIDDGGLSQQLAQLQIQADLSKTTFERQERLWKQKIGSEMQYLQAKSSYEAQTKAVSQMQEQIEKTIVKAPFSGIIDDVISEQGSMVSPGGSQLMRILNLDNMYIETNVPEKHLTSITKNKNVEVEFPILGKTIKSTIRETGNYINPANRTFKVEISLPNDNNEIKPNLTAKVKINDYTSEKALLIPQSIISENAQGEQYVYVIKNRKGKDGIAEKAIITTGKTQGDVIEVLSGIENGTEMIIEGARSIQDGQTVKILNL
ncbi:efflux RND transporter periplasmic adaptor subunit [Vicingus serpentipes]|uniref:Efflux RND transporter periplasmic adaptor subunit n=1 Tax=Vicingus serpentipes TaxID=1926625 RepID=A0A5C6RNP5_9FLAO|nr:efflux RND transporter periplasmic adaptor subunit [Vicingus serpentipes]TXB63926.1 efflux RND transporter periplasmic adaptor subunit [Vicingus serpentipes]